MTTGDIVTLSWFGVTHNDPRKNMVGLVIKTVVKIQHTACYVLWPDDHIDVVFSRYLLKCEK